MDLIKVMEKRVSNEDIIISLKGSINKIECMQLNIGDYDEGLFCIGEQVALGGEFGKCLVLSDKFIKKEDPAYIYDDYKYLTEALTKAEKEKYIKLNSYNMAPCFPRMGEKVKIDNERCTINGKLYKLCDDGNITKAQVNIIYKEAKNAGSICVSEMGSRLVVDGYAAERKYIRMTMAGIVKPILIEHEGIVVALDCMNTYITHKDWDNWERKSISDMDITNDIKEQLKELNIIINRYRKNIGVIGLCEYHHVIL